MNPARPCAVLLDALGTLLALRDPVGGLVAALGRRDVTVAHDAAARAMAAEIAHYRAVHDRASTCEGLWEVRAECAAVVEDELATGLAPVDVRDALLEAIRFAAHPEVPAVLAALRAAGARLAVVSNWDVSLHDVLAQTGLADAVDAVVVSAVVGAAKPAGAIFAAALDELGVRADVAVHVGDDVVTDVGGALAAGLGAVLVDREGGARAPAGVPVLRTLAGLDTVLGYR